MSQTGSGDDVSSKLRQYSVVDTSDKRSVDCGRERERERERVSQTGSGDDVSSKLRQYSVVDTSDKRSVDCGRERERERERERGCHKLVLATTYLLS